MATAYIYFGRPINLDTSTSFMKAVHTLMGQNGGKLSNGEPAYLWDTLRVSIASGGGDVVAGFALYNEMTSTDVTFHTHNAAAVDSVALLPFLAGIRRTASRYSGFLLHQMTWTFPFTGQTRTQIADVTGWLGNYDHVMAQVIAERTDISFDDAQLMMRNGANLTPQQALECGVIHAIENPTKPRDAATWQV
ncbi:ATP-dependent Clp protease proteolytic subunit [Shinella zoogloeoides]|uniref:ATP-dependent Clp protease proteolytic subunit n=1 Tax=Shinella zoogloeoides TaxID=352475 RepID=UPI0028A5821B|nr:ATP-dependent Clp protease proteolytic subunit [Shinella zoogloeoides]